MDLPSSHQFYVVVRWNGKMPKRLTMDEASWYEALTFTLADGSNISSVTRWGPEVWIHNPSSSWMFEGGGYRIIAVDFTNGSWRGFSSKPTEARSAMMTAAFHCNESKQARFVVQSKPTSVSLVTLPTKDD